MSEVTQKATIEKQDEQLLEARNIINTAIREARSLKEPDVLTVLKYAYKDALELVPYPRNIYVFKEFEDYVPQLSSAYSAVMILLKEQPRNQKLLNRAHSYKRLIEDATRYFKERTSVRGLYVDGLLTFTKQGELVKLTTDNLLALLDEYQQMLQTKYEEYLKRHKPIR